MIKKYFVYPSINPIIFSIGFLHFRWYSLTYLIGFLFIFTEVKKNVNYFTINLQKKINDLLYYGFLGLLIGGRIGYILFYNIFFFIKNPLYILYIWNGGMSFHGGLIGMIIVFFIILNGNKKDFFNITDIISKKIPIILGIGRLCNFINCELIGRVSINNPLSILFPNSKYEDLIYIKYFPKFINIYKTYGSLPRHPSQIYEFILEGVIIYIILNIYKNKKKYIGRYSSIFLILYSIFRFFVEFFRQPDIQIGLFFKFLTMGQILCFPMLIIGIYIFIKKFK